MTAPKTPTPEVAVTRFDPGSPAYEAARSEIESMLRSIGSEDEANGYTEMADDLHEGDLMEVPTWVALQALASARIAASTPRVGPYTTHSFGPDKWIAVEDASGRVVAQCPSLFDADKVSTALNATLPAAVERGEVAHGLGPHATVIEDHPDGYQDVALLVGTGTVYLQQGDAQIFVGFKQADAILSALSRDGGGW